MRRPLSIALLAFTVLASCARKSPLPPEEVLRRAVLASGQLQSASFNVQLEAQSFLPELLGTAKVSLAGVLQDGGHETRFLLDGKGSLVQAGQPFAADVRAEVASNRNRDLFFLVEKLELTPEHPLLSRLAIDQLLGTWWKVPKDTKAGAVPVSPDPALLRAQSEVVRVTRDRGILERDGHESYHYDVVLDEEKMAAFLEKIAEDRGEKADPAAMKEQISSYKAAGELWIDSETFAVREISWTLGSKDGKQAPYALIIRAVIGDHNVASPVAFPAQAKIFTGLAALAVPKALSGSSVSPGSVPTAP